MKMVVFARVGIKSESKNTVTLGTFCQTSKFLCGKLRVEQNNKGGGDYWSQKVALVGTFYSAT